MIIQYTWSDFDSDVEQIVSILREKGKGYACVYGVPRGGGLLAYALRKELGYCIVNNPEMLSKKVLIVDDIIDSGMTRKKFKEFDFLSLHTKSKTPASINRISWTFSLHSVNKKDWVNYPWEEKGAQFGPTDAVTRLIEFMGDDPQREGLKETPTRVVNMLKFLSSGYREKLEDTIKIFTLDKGDEIILLKDIEIYSLCEHHMLPFFGKAHIAYIPNNNRVIGVSKLARILDTISHKLQIQERIGEEVTYALMTYLKPKGAACIIEAQHMCMMMRGVQKQNSVMVTSSLKGVFLEDQRARNELMELLGR